jgi:para-aminobenzoate synthetase component 1
MIPVARRLDLDQQQNSGVELCSLFGRLRQLPHCVWLDSASDHAYDRGRYSFITADPVAWCRADMNSPDPWPVLGQWCRSLQHAGLGSIEATHPDARDKSPAETALPPFCGGIVAMIAYEAAWWLEPTLRPPAAQVAADLPGMAIGVYDWTIAVDHQTNQTWLLSTGLSETFAIDMQRAEQRADQIMQWIKPGSESASPHEYTARQCNVQEQPSPRLASVSSNFTDSQFAAGVTEIIRRIRNGDSFQVNLAQTLTHPATCSSGELYERLRQINPAPYATYFDCGDYQIISSSPEGFLQVRVGPSGERIVITRPIKGTVARTGDDTVDKELGEKLLRSQKDHSENIMIVDLMRNDLSRVCLDESVEVTGLCELERYQRVQHLVSTVRGVLGPDAGIADLLQACFPGGSITGAPKVEAMRTIAELERAARGPYCGSLGYVSLSGAADFNILIRTITSRHNSAGDAIWEFPVGGGITAQSDPDRETEETWVKAASLLEAIASTG